jgi:hypothetical protein
VFRHSVALRRLGENIALEDQDDYDGAATEYS